MSKLNERQKRFADEYIISGNAYKSAIEAGYSEKYSKTDSHKLLENTRIKSYIEERLAELEKKKIATQDEVLQYLTSVMRGEYKDETLIGRGDGFQEITDIKVSTRDRVKAADILNKLYQVSNNKDSSNTTNNILIVNDIPTED